MTTKSLQSRGRRAPGKRVAKNRCQPRPNTRSLGQPALAAGGQPLAAAHQLVFDMQHQVRSNWCWSAVGTSTAAYFRPATAWVQCLLANRVLARNDCCTDSTGASNQQAPLGDALVQVGHLGLYSGGVPRFEDIAAEVAGGRPVGARIQWSGGGSHFVALTGYDQQTREVTVRDPENGTRTMSYEIFRDDYMDAGYCTDTYWIRPGPGVEP